jgi:hypothetical protein
MIPVQGQLAELAASDVGDECQHVQYDGVSTAGPVPTIFSEDQQATIDATVSDPAQAHKDVTKINRQEQFNTKLIRIKTETASLMICVLQISLFYAVSS